METAAHEGRVYEGDRSIKAAALFEAATGLKRSLLLSQGQRLTFSVLRGSLSLAAPGAEPATPPTAVDFLILRPGLSDQGPVEGYLSCPIWQPGVLSLDLRAPNPVILYRLSHSR